MSARDISVADGWNRLEGVIRDCLANDDHQRIEKIVQQLCHDYAYQTHAPHARNGGLIGLAAAAIALGPVGFLYTRTPDKSTDVCINRRSPATSKKSSLPSLPASPTKMLACDTMPVRACTTLQRWPRGKSWCTLTKSLMLCAK